MNNGNNYKKVYIDKNYPENGQKSTLREFLSPWRTTMMYWIDLVIHGPLKNGKFKFFQCTE